MQDKKLSFAIFGNEYQTGKSVGIEQVLSSLYECTELTEEMLTITPDFFLNILSAACCAQWK